MLDIVAGTTRLPQVQETHVHFESDRSHRREVYERRRSTKRSQELSRSSQGKRAEQAADCLCESREASPL